MRSPDRVESMRATGVRRRVASSALTWVLVLGVVRITVLLPENCPPVDSATIRAAVDEAVAWFDRNQAPDGTWLYRYDRGTDEVGPGYNTVRHAGVTMSLYQAARAGIPGALDIADRGTAYAVDNLVRHEGWAAFEPSSSRVTSGAAALLVAGLVERRTLTGDERHDELLADLSEFLVSLVEDDGAVLASWDREREAPDTGVYSPFFTGEVLWALALMDQEFPHGGWGAPARRIGHYLATERDDAEGYWPDVPDHWAAYGFAVLASSAGPDSDPLSDPEMEYLRRQAGFGGVQARYESQRVDTTPRWWLRGRRTLGGRARHRRRAVGRPVGGVERRFAPVGSRPGARRSVRVRRRHARRPAGGRRRGRRVRSSCGGARRLVPVRRDPDGRPTARHVGAPAHAGDAR